MIIVITIIIIIIIIVIIMIMIIIMITLPGTNIMVGILLSYWGGPIFRGYVSFRQGIMIIITSWERLKPKSDWK